MENFVILSFEAYQGSIYKENVQYIIICLRQ